MKCYECGHDFIVTSEPFEQTYKKFVITIENVEHYVCPNCGELAFDSGVLNDIDKKCASEYARRNGF